MNGSRSFFPWTVSAFGLGSYGLRLRRSRRPRRLSGFRSPRGLRLRNHGLRRHRLMGFGLRIDGVGSSGFRSHWLRDRSFWFILGARRSPSAALGLLHR